MTAGVSLYRRAGTGACPYIMGIVGDGPCAVPYFLTEYPYVENVFNPKAVFRTQAWSVLRLLCYIEHENYANGGKALTQMKHRANKMLMQACRLRRKG